MRHGKKVKKLGRKREHRQAMLKNLCRALFIYEKIKTTLVKAKESRRLAERIIEFAKVGNLAAKRRIYRFIPDHKLVKIICEEIAPRFSTRQGGYTRIYRLGPRLGDGAEMVIMELTEHADFSTIAQRRKLIERGLILDKEKRVKEKKKKVKKEKKPQKEKVKKEEKKQEKLKKEKVKKEEKSKKEKKPKK